MREDELKEALSRLRVVVPDPRASSKELPSSGAFVARPADPPPIIDESDDPYALPRFREPPLSLPDHDRTFLRAIGVKPRLVFCTWDVSREARGAGLEAPVELQLFWRDFLGDPPPAADILRQPPAARIDVDLASAGWYVNVPGERLALAAALVVVSSSGGRRLVESNVCITPPARPAPPGPLWMATLPPSFDRRRLGHRKIFDGPEGDLRRVGESDARGLEIEDEGDLPASQTRARLPWLAAGGHESSSSSSAAGGDRGGRP
jgi:hypothetical protein